MSKTIIPRGDKNGLSTYEFSPVATPDVPPLTPEEEYRQLAEYWEERATKLMEKMEDMKRFQDELLGRLEAIAGHAASLTARKLGCINPGTEIEIAPDAPVRALFKEGLSGVTFKPPKPWERDYILYIENADKFKFTGSQKPYVPCSADGRTAKEAFKTYDSTGVMPLCCEPAALKVILGTKKAINLQIKQWAEGFDDMHEPIETYLAEFKNPLDWVHGALKNAIEKHRKKKAKDGKRL